MTSAGQADNVPGHRDPMAYFPQAASAAIGGQISSALGVFGVNDSPAWLKGISSVIGQVKVSDKATGKAIFDGANPLGGLFGQGSAGSSAAPLAATSTATGTPPPDDAGNVHGTRAGQAPGPQNVTNYHIRTATVEDAFLAAQRKQNERNAAKLSVY
jgi:hypothetical protein